MKIAGWSGGLAAVGVAGAGLREPHDLSIERIEVRLPRLPSRLDGFRLLQISDFHFNEFTHADHLRQVINAANAEHADLAVLTGDFVTVPMIAPDKPQAAQNAWPCAAVLRELRTQHGSFAVLGNHDVNAAPSVVIEALESHNIPVLQNSSVPIERDGGRLWLAGTQDALKARPDFDRSLQSVPAGECVVMAVHEPDVADRVSRYPVDLQLSGHSHGGQIRLPLVGAPVLPDLAKKYPMGYYRVGNLQLYTNRGIGVIIMPVRFLCPPELTVITLRAGGKL